MTTALRAVKSLYSWIEMNAVGNLALNGICCLECGVPFKEKMHVCVIIGAFAIVTLDAVQS